MSMIASKSTRWTRIFEDLARGSCINSDCLIRTPRPSTSRTYTSHQRCSKWPLHSEHFIFSLHGSKPTFAILQGHSHCHHRSLHTANGGGLQLLSSRWGAQVSSPEEAQKFVASLRSEQKLHLEKALIEAREEEKEKNIVPPTWNQLKLLCYQHSLPFIGFGFLDNFIMITVGEYIDITIGAMLGISTMAAAGLGNLISDLAGLGLADRVEAFCNKVGIPNPQLSSAQLLLKSSRRMALLGRCLGITIGCIIGMAPLLWFTDHHKQTSTSDNQP